jgi:hypothetical protein
MHKKLRLLSPLSIHVIKLVFPVSLVNHQPVHLS